jgi:hypothetical protein
MGRFSASIFVPIFQNGHLITMLRINCAIIVLLSCLPNLTKCVFLYGQLELFLILLFKIGIWSADNCINCVWFVLIMLSLFFFFFLVVNIIPPDVLSTKKIFYCKMAWFP